MTLHCTFHLQTRTSPSVLPRILLAFSRRRLTVQALQYYDLDETRPAELQLDVDCSARVADDVARQLRRIVEVNTIRLEMQELDETSQPPDSRAA